MAIHHLKDGEDFGPRHFDRSFGFHGSAEGVDQATRGNPGSGASVERGAPNGYAHGGNVDQDTVGNPGSGGSTERGAPNSYAHGGHMHPHGHHVVRVRHHEDGRVVHHHAHGGHTVHHPDGHITHHESDGSFVYTPHAGEPMMDDHGADGDTYVERMRHGGHHEEHRRHGGHHMEHRRHGGHHERHLAHGGEVGDDAQMARMERDRASDSGLYRGEEAIRASGDIGRGDNGYAHGGEVSRGGDDAGLYRGEGSIKASEDIGRHDNGYARGGHAGERVRLPRGMKPPAERRHSPIGDEMPINRAPRRPEISTTPRNDMPGGKMPYGVEPSAEPDAAGSEQGITSLRHGGRLRHRR